MAEETAELRTDLNGLSVVESEGGREDGGEGCAVVMEVVVEGTEETGMRPEVDLRSAAPSLLLLVRSFLVVGSSAKGVEGRDGEE